MKKLNLKVIIFLIMGLVLVNSLYSLANFNYYIINDEYITIPILETQIKIAPIIAPLLITTPFAIIFIINNLV